MISAGEEVVKNGNMAHFSTLREGKKKWNEANSTSTGSKVK